jgi:coenzyme F420-dependent glucose-6-phosphate dehydrogenase
MTEIGYALTSELHNANELVCHAQQAEAAGFKFAMVSDHFHPFFNRHGESPFIWSVIGAIAHTTRTLRLGSGVTCPLLRYHPAIIAQAAATCETMMPGRFFLGVGTGANLNEHVVGAGWPAPAVRVDMLEEAIGIIRLLWQGGQRSYQGQYYDLDQARLYSLPAVPPPLIVAASGRRMAEMAARLGDGLVGLSPDKALVDTYLAAGDVAKAPRYAQMAVCWGKDEAAARRTALDWWPLGLLPGKVIPELPLPGHYEALAAPFTTDDITRAVVCGADADAHLAKIQEFVDAGFTHIYVHQIGPDQEGFMHFYQDRILPTFHSA